MAQNRDRETDRIERGGRVQNTEEVTAATRRTWLPLMALALVLAGLAADCEEPPPNRPPNPPPWTWMVTR